MKNDESIPLIKVAPKPTADTSSQKPPTETNARTVVISEQEMQETANPHSLTSQYTILEKIGEGGMGVVYLARDRKLGRYAAIKRLSRSALSHASLKERFMREARAVAALNHIHIVHIYSLGEDDDGPYIVMEYLAGPQEASPGKTPPAPFTLADRVNRNGPLLVNDAVDLVMKICKAVEFAHACGVIHRDLKPSNILLDETGEPKIVDFGLAHVADQNADPLTVPGEKMLSLGYGAPEQEQDASLTDERADIYGLGAILYFSITGKNPRYFRENDVPETLRMPILKALETDREKRWPNVRDFTSALNMIKEPSKIELPTVKTTWRCKWCDTVNPIAIQFCGKCGWDGGELCPECGSETRVSIQFCGNCGADAREYEQAALLLRRLKQFQEQKQFELIPPHAERIASFRPVGLSGQKLVEQIRTLSREAQDAVARRDKLREAVAAELTAQNYERAKEYVDEYNRLATDNIFANALKDMPDLTVKRDLERARKAIVDREWDYAERTCQWILNNISKDNAEAQKILSVIGRQRRQTRRRRTVILLVGLFVLYLLSAAPAFRLAGNPPAGACTRIYTPVIAIHDSTFLQKPLEIYAAWFGATNLFRSQGLTAELPMVGPTEKDDKIAALRLDYESVLAKLDLDYNKKKESWPNDYLNALSDLKQRIQKAGDFDGWVAVKNEIDRFNIDKKLSDENLVATPPDLRTLQIKHQGLLSQYSLEKSSKILLAMQDYTNNKLTPLQKDFTMRGKMNDAMKVNTEIKRVKTSPEVAAAELEIEKHDTAQDQKK
jgi:serine/threonine protein kinase